MVIKPELAVIHYLLNHNNWLKYGSYLEANNFSDELKLVYRTLNSAHTTQETPNNLSVLDLSLLVFSNNPKNKEYYEALFENLSSLEVLEDSVLFYIHSLRRNTQLRKLAISAYESAEGKKDYTDVKELIDSLQSLDVGTSTNTEPQEQFVSTSLVSLLESQVNKPGLSWRLKELNQSLGSLRLGDFGFIFARPETGKTTCLASEVSHMLTQTDKNVLWANNEEQGDKVVLRIIQAYFGLTLTELLANPDKYDQLFTEQTGSRLKFYDKPGFSKQELEKVCSQVNPGLIVLDQIDKIKGFVADRNDLQLGQIYRWARELAKQYGPCIGVCQADGQGEGVKYLTMSHVSDAKTSKQAEADWIVGIGATHDQGYEAVRFFNISKNKLLGDIGITDPKMRHGKFEALIKPEIARYESIGKK